MKTKKYQINFLFIALIAITFGCKKEITSAHSSVKIESELKGKWNLVHVYGGIMGVNEQYPAGDVTWNFTADSVIVEHIGTNSSYFSLPSGTYAYDVIQTGGNTYLSISQSEMGQFIISGNNMDIDQNKYSTGEGACGFYMELER